MSDNIASAGLEATEMTELREKYYNATVIERIEIVREDIIAQSDPWPNFLNRLHMTTREYIVRQEILVAPGQQWNQDKVDESARNLRRLFILAVVRAIPCKSSRPGHVILLVVTKDLWSIRMNTSCSLKRCCVDFHWRRHFQKSWIYRMRKELNPIRFLMPLSATGAR